MRGHNVRFYEIITQLSKDCHLNSTLSELVSWCYFEADASCVADALTFCRQKPVYCVKALLLSQLMYSAMSGMSEIVRLLGIRWNLVHLKNLFL